MKQLFRILLLTIIVNYQLSIVNCHAQTLNVKVGSVTYQFPASQTGEMTYANGETVTIMGKTFTLTDITAMTVDNSKVSDGTIGVSYGGSEASVTVAGNVTSAAGDGINCAEYFLMESGTINISGTQDDGIQCDIDGDASDDAINASYNDDTKSLSNAGDLTISGGYVYARSTGNDGIDANGNVYIKGGVIYAIGTTTPEVAIDANSEEQKKLYVTGGTIIAIGGLENGAQLTQSCYQASSWNKNTWYAMTVGSETFVFKTPSSGGNTMVVSGASQPTLKSGVTVSGGTSIFDGVAYTGATFTGGSSVTLSSYTGGGGGPGGGPGGPGGWH